MPQPEQPRRRTEAERSELHRQRRLSLYLAAVIVGLLLMLTSVLWARIGG